MRVHPGRLKLRRLRVGGICLLAALAAAACGGGTSDDSDADEAASDESTPAPGEATVELEGGSMESMLGLVPEESGASDQVIVADYEAATEAAGVDRPEEGASEDEIAEWSLALTANETGLGLYLSGFFGDEFVDDEAWREEIGWAPIDVDQSVDVTSDEFGSLFAFRGRFDPAAIDEAVRQDPAWSDELETEEHNGIPFYSWGEDDATLENITAVRNIGRGGRMAVLDEETILWSWATEPIEAAIDAATGEADSLADDEELAALARGLDDEGALGGLLTSQGAELSAAGAIPDLTDLSSTFEPDLDAPVLAPVASLATGIRWTDDEPALILHLLHGDDSTAEENAERLGVIIEQEEAPSGQPWSEVVSLDSAESDGPRLLAILALLDPTQATLWADAYFQRASILASE